MISSILEARHKDLIVETLSVALRLDEGLWATQPEVSIHRLAEQTAYELRATLRLPSEVVQDRELARWPDGWREAVKWAARGWWPWKLRVRFRYVRLKEQLLYPDIPLPPYSRHVRVYWATSEGICALPE